jgi:hypothetical protein
MPLDCRIDFPAARVRLDQDLSADASVWQPNYQRELSASL